MTINITTFLRSLLRGVFFLPHAYYVVVFYLFLLFLLSFLFLFLVYLIFLHVFVSSVSLPGDDVLCWLFSCLFPSVCFSQLFFLQTCSWFDLVWSRLFCDHG